MHVNKENTVTNFVLEIIQIKMKRKLIRRSNNPYLYETCAPLTIIMQYCLRREKYMFTKKKKWHKLFPAKIEIEGCSEIGRSTFSFHFYAMLPAKDDCISSDSKMQADWYGVA